MKKTSVIKVIVNEISRLRRIVGQSFLVFRKNYFEHYHKKPDGVMQKDLSDLLSSVANGRIKRLAVAAPRGFAKSTIVSLEFVIYCMCHKKKNFILIISNTQDQAEGFLRDIKRELETNERLLNDFPELKKKSKKSHERRWAQNEIIIPNGARVLALSISTELRGRRHGEFRPDLIILDDIETNEATRNPESAQRLEELLTKTVLKSGDDYTSVIFIGTLHNPNSLLSKYTDPKQIPGWAIRIYKAVIKFAKHIDLWEQWSRILLNLETYNDAFGPDAARAFYEANKDKMLEGVELLWSERLSYYDLMVIREQDGIASFDSELQNEPFNDRNCIFNIKDIRFWDDEYKTEEELLRSRGGHLLIYGACDPSMGKNRESGDFSAIVTVAVDDMTKIIYILDVDIARRSPDRTMNAILEYGKIRQYTKFGFESNQFQSLMLDELRKRIEQSRYDLLIKEVNNTSNKQLRIEWLQPMVMSGRIQLSRRHRALIEEMKYYPKGPHDDALDATEMACRLAIKSTCFPQFLYRK